MLLVAAVSGGIWRQALQAAKVCSGVPGAGPGVLWGQVDASEPLFAERAQLVTLTIGGDRLGPGGDRCTARVPLEQRWLLGEQVEVTFRPDALHCFDTAGHRIGG